MKKKQKKTRNIKRAILIISIILIVFCVIKIFSKTKNIRYNNINLIISDKNITSDLNNDIIKREDVIYLSYADIQKFVDNTIFFEEESKTVIMTSDKKLASIKLDEEEITINGAIQKIYCKAFEENNIIYLPISELKNVYDIEIEYNESTNIVTIDYLSKKLQKAYVSKNVKIKQSKDRFSNYIEKVKKGNWVIFFEDEEGKAKIRTQNGKIGYVKTKYLDNFVSEREDLLDSENISFEKYLELDISKKDISNFEKRSKLISDIWLEAVKGDYRAVKIKYNNEKEEITRLKIELTPFLKESGIYTIIN